MEGYKWNVIHFNNGIHGHAYTNEEYREGYKKTLDYLARSAPTARVVAVLSTPPRPGSPPEISEQIKERNDIVRKLAAARKLPLNDLHTPFLGRKEYYRDEFHFKRPAIEKQAQQVAEKIRPLLEKKPEEKNR